ncbi:uncharacterized protein LOC135079146 [Ostrinia nubilalis]|uniref:uncharacterized protein LOC135079146 n=1 Tax=Ostrinia nubilalis TaxID=29057 RepID=UPI00308230BB
MELMSSLLLCVLVVLLPQTLGISRVRSPPRLEIRFNNSLLIQQKPHTLRKQILLNINGPPLVNNVTELQTVFTALACKRCHNCMERAIRAYKVHNHIISNRPSAEELQEDVLTNEISYRTKRDIAPTSETIIPTSTEAKTTKKFRAKKNKINRAVMVTKYNIDGDVYALKVKEQLNADQNDTKTCQVYSVKRSFPCDSAEGEALLSSARRKANKRKAKKEQDKTSTTPTTQKTQTSVFRKREVDNSQMPENFMPSIEELY